MALVRPNILKHTHTHSLLQIFNDNIILRVFENCLFYFIFTRATGLYYTSSSPTKKKNNDSVHVLEVGDGGDKGVARPRSLQQTGDAAAVCWMCPPCTLDRRVSLPEPWALQRDGLHASWQQTLTPQRTHRSTCHNATRRKSEISSPRLLLVCLFLPSRNRLLVRERNYVRKKNNTNS